MKYLVLDIGGSSIKYAIMDKEANIICKDNVVTPRDSIDSFVNQISGIYDNFKNEVDGIAISMPGMIDSKTGYAYTGGLLDYIDNINMIELLNSICDKRITVENDGKCATKAEHWIGSLKGCKEAAVIVLGSGVGGGIIANGSVIKGKHFSAGEFSFIKTSINEHSKMENIWGAKNGTEFLVKGLANKKKIDSNGLDGVKFFNLANAGDKDALDILDDFCKNLGVQIFNLQLTIDCEKIAIGGGISAQEILFKYINKNLEEIYNSFPIKVPRASVVQAKYLNDSNLIGALYTHLYE